MSRMHGCTGAAEALILFYTDGMIALFTDYGLSGPYLGQVEAVLHELAPTEKVINIFADAPACNPKAGAYLLAAYSKALAEGSVFFCVVDPGVGGKTDTPIILNIDNRKYVGPDNGLFDIVANRAHNLQCQEITWRPENLSSSFHGRDIYAPVCAMLVNDLRVPGRETRWLDQHHWPADLDEIIYIDHFGNCITGVRDEALQDSVIIKLADRRIKAANTFSDVPVGEVFWYKNANGLIEIAVNQGHAARELSLEIGSRLIFC